MEPHIHSGKSMQQPNILLAEDNPVNQLVARKILEGIGCDVTIAATGLEAVAKACERRFDLILMDLHMPHMDGLEATRNILSMSAHRPVVIACTAHVSAGHRAECGEGKKNHDTPISYDLTCEEELSRLRTLPVPTWEL